MATIPLLLIGYGNPDRQDDGVAWHVLSMIADRLHRPHPQEIEDGLEDLSASPGLMSVLQLTPELAEIVSQSTAVCFIDAHTGSIEEDLRLIPIGKGFQTSPLTHHMTPQTVLSLANSLYGRSPDGYLLSIRGYQFGFSHELSPQTRLLAQQAAGQLWEWLQQRS